MIRRIQVRRKKSSREPDRNGIEDALILGEKDNPYRPGTVHHDIYDRAFDWTMREHAREKNRR